MTPSYDGTERGRVHMSGGIGRRDFVAGLATASAIAGSSLSAGAPRSPRLPNIIFIMADDLGYADLSCTGSRNNKTPHIDSLAANGLMLKQGYANSSVCSPTRTGLLSGCYQQRFRVGLEEPIGQNTPEGIGLPYDRRTIASVMRAQGYQTALVGKWHLGDPPKHGPLSHGYDSFFGIAQGGADYFRHKAVMGGKEQGPGLWNGNEEVAREGYLTDLFGDEAVRLIKGPRTKPLFLSLHFNAPHWPWEGREDAEVARTMQNFFHFTGGSLETYAKMVAAMDDNVGKVLAALKAKGELENTLIVFTSDNGGERYSDTWPFTGIKGELLEGGIRVPILMQWPGQIVRESVSQQVMISMDFLPTFLAIAGGTAKPGEFDGVDLSAHITGKAAVTERTLFWRFKADEQAAVRQGDWKYLKLGGKEHLFNVVTDPRERAELRDAQPEKMHALRALYDKWNSQMLPYPLNSYSQSNKQFYPDRY